MATGLIVRDTRASDMPAIVEIYAKAVVAGAASFELEPPSLEEMCRRRERLRAENYPYLTAEIDGRLAGYAYAGPYRPRPAYRFTVEDTVYVADWALRRGVGRALLRALVDACVRGGRHQMVAVIGGRRNEASIKLHEAVGFEEVGTLRGVGFKHGAWQDTVLMQRPLISAEVDGPPV